jgi:membrane-bound inhibitor of C-type lysozyme
MQENKKMVWMGLGGVLVIVGLFWFANFLKEERVPEGALKTPQNEQVASEEARRTTYVCENNFSVDVVFTGNLALLTLPDGKELSLTQTVAASGVRFANQDESFIFWTKGPSASIQEGATVTYNDCIEPKQ